MKKKLLLQITSLAIIVSLAMLITYMPKRASSQRGIAPVTVFVHGYKGTANSFGGMLDRFERRDWGSKALVYYVSKNGNMQVYNVNQGKKKPKFVQVVFENNRANFDDSATWLSKVMNHLKERYHIDSVNLVGHSMGGLVSLKYTEEYQDKTQYPAIGKLVTIGSPFDGIYSQKYFQFNRDAAATDLKPDSPVLQLLKANGQAFPEDVAVLNIGSTGDLVAVPESVQTLRTIIPAHQITEKMIENGSLGHSDLHENDQVDKMIHSFLWQDEVQ